MNFKKFDKQKNRPHGRSKNHFSETFLGSQNPQKSVLKIGCFSGSEIFKNRLLKTWIFQCLKSAKIAAKKQLFSRQKHTKYLQKSIFLQVFGHHFILFCTLYHRNFRYFCHKNRRSKQKSTVKKQKYYKNSIKKAGIRLEIRYLLFAKNHQWLCPPVPLCKMSPDMETT